ncbi:winged helix-turn-helix transcriptional regulator [Microbacterium sp. P07]|uniref:winged helix-turn-helix transcriptional regulator n=1 Tax=Microbacterium sp. P07 TaxID=3366952 RepID=UPI00374583AF
MTTATAAQKKAAAKASYDAFLAESRSRRLFERVSDKWVPQVLCALSGRWTTSPDSACETPSESGVAAAEPTPHPLRSAELARMLAGVSQKMLTQTLRSLERDGLITRTVVPTVPVTVSYELTDLGLSLHRTLRTLKGWAETNMDDVLAHRERHDEDAA